jgi:hypothetical protein
MSNPDALRSLDREGGRQLFGVVPDLLGCIATGDAVAAGNPRGNPFSYRRVESGRPASPSTDQYRGVSGGVSARKMRHELPDIKVCFAIVSYLAALTVEVDR